MSDKSLSSNTRAVSFNVSYIIGIAIIAIVLVGVGTTMGGYISTQQDRVITEQITIIGDQTASAVMAANRAANIDKRTNTTLQHKLPSEAVNTQYTVTLRSSDGNAEIFVQALGEGYTYTAKLNTNAGVIESTVQGGQQIAIVYQTNPGTGIQTVKLVESDTESESV